MFKIETHLHTQYCSRCGRLTAQAIVAGCKAAGYSALVVTDHYNRETFRLLGVDLTAAENKIHRFLEGYRLVREAGALVGLRVYKGAELRFDECDNDYLLYGFPDELLADPEAVFRMGIAAFSPLARQAGAILIQAHPYRRRCTPAIACYLDGIEVWNQNPRHSNRNALAMEYAKEFRLLDIAGSDCHQPEDIAATGLLAETLPYDFADLLRSRDFRLLGLEDWAN